jgi:hypothetical protein
MSGAHRGLLSRAVTYADSGPESTPARIAALLVDPYVGDMAMALPRLESHWQDLILSVEIWLALADDADIAGFDPQSGDEVRVVLARRPESQENVQRVVADLTRAAAC